MKDSSSFFIIIEDDYYPYKKMVRKAAYPYTYRDYYEHLIKIKKSIKLYKHLML
jgi:hypothetical protein